MRLRVLSNTRELNRLPRIFRCPCRLRVLSNTRELNPCEVCNGVKSQFESVVKYEGAQSTLHDYTGAAKFESVVKYEGAQSVC